MKSTMVLWLYSAEQFRDNIPICEIAEHAEINGFNDEPVDVLCLHGFEFIPAVDLAKLKSRNFHVQNMSALYTAIAARFPNLRARYTNHFFECFLRWVVLKEFYAGQPILAWDADIFFNEKLSRLHADLAGSTLTSSSTCFVALHDPAWLETYERELRGFEAASDNYLAGVFENLRDRHAKDPAAFADCFFGQRSAAAFRSRTAWDELFSSKPEEMFVDYLVRTGLLPHHVAGGQVDYLFCAQPLLLPQLEWVHPMGSGLVTEASKLPLEKRAGQYWVGDRRLAFIHFQGALFRACAIHQFWANVPNGPVSIHDEFYSLPEHRRGTPTSHLVSRRQAMEKWLAEAPDFAAKRERLGDFFSERDVARNYLIRSDLAPVFTALGLGAVTPEPDFADLPRATQLSEKVDALGRYFENQSRLHLEWTEKGMLASHCPARSSFSVARSLPSAGASLLALPSACVETLINEGSLERLRDDEMNGALMEFYRITESTLILSVALSPTRSRDWWEAQCFRAGFRKHARYQAITPYESLEYHGARATLTFEKIPAEGLAKYPLSVLEAERDLHNDMTRVSGRRSDAHIARYVLARHYLPKEGIVIDGACGLGYGSAVLACGHPDLEIVGMDCSEFAVSYGQATFSPAYPNVRFRTGDVCDLSAFPDGSVGLVVSFETIEHLREPEKFLQEVRRVLKPDGNFIGSVPNRWVDENGKDPNPWHFHVFDFGKIVELCGKYLSVRDVFNQTAGGGMKLGAAPRRIQRVALPFTQSNEVAEWWLVAASREQISAPPVQPEAPADTIMVLTHDAKHPLFSSWLGGSTRPVVYEHNVGVGFEFPPHIGLVVTADCYNQPRPTLLCKAREQGIPTLLLADGILEYRNTFDHPEITPGAIFQPVLADKIACLGRSQARILESWGNAAQCEITGSARFDRYATLRRRQRPAGAPFRVLVMTAITPYFTPSQHELVRQSLLDLKAFFAATATVGDVPLQVDWRVTKGMQDEIGVQSMVTDLTGRELADVLQNVDAIISTPSTSMVEAMLLGLPVAVLDYCNCPHYVQPAWRITARDHILSVVSELVSPPAAKLLFQETVLHDTLECRTPAATRLLQLTEAMLVRGQQARAAGVPLELPPRLLTLSGNSPAGEENRFDLPALFPEHAPFAERDLRLLQVEVGQLRGYAARLEHATTRSVSQVEAAKIKADAELAILWRSRLEAGIVLASLKQTKPAVELMLQSLKSVENCKQPEVILTALVTVSAQLRHLDPARSRAFLGIAHSLATRMQKPEVVRQVNELLGALPAARSPQPHSAAVAA